MKKLLIGLIIISFSVHGNAEDEYSLLSDSLNVAIEQILQHPDSLELRMQKARWNMLLEQWSRAKEEYDFVLSRKPDHLPARLYRAYANEQLSRYSFAKADYEYILVQYPDHLEALMGLTVLLQKMGHLSAALDKSNLLVNLYGDRAESFAVRAGIEKTLKLLELAAEDYSKALELDNDNTDYLLNRLEIYLRLGKEQTAQSDIHHLELLGIPVPALKQLKKSIIQK